MEQSLVKDLESSLQACVSTLVSQGRTETDDINKTGVESCIEKFLHSARNLEGYFAKYQMYSMVNHPQDAIREDIIKLQEELVKKETLLNALQEKSLHWNDQLHALITRQNRMFVIDQEQKASHQM